MTPMTFQKYLTKDSTHAHHQDAQPDAAPQFSAFARKCEQLHLNALAAHVRSGQEAGFVRPGSVDARAAMLLLVLQASVQSAPLVEEWLDVDSWRTELAAAVRGLLEIRG